LAICAGMKYSPDEALWAMALLAARRRGDYKIVYPLRGSAADSSRLTAVVRTL